MDADRDTPAAARNGPGGKSTAARSASARRGSGPALTHARPLAEAAFAQELDVDDARLVTTPAVLEPAVPEPAAPEPAVPEASEPAAPEPRIPAPAKIVRRTPRVPVQPVVASGVAVAATGLTKRFGDLVAVDAVDLTVQAGTMCGFVGPNGAGKTTTLAMITGLLRPDSGTVTIHGADVWANATVAKRMLGVLPDQMKLFDRLTGAEHLHYAGALRGIDKETIARRIDDLATEFGLQHSLDRLVSDYSAGMVKKIAIAAAMIHSPRVLVLDEPFESVDPVSAQVVIDLLTRYAAAGGTVLLSSHSMTLIERTCDAVAIIADGRMLAAGPMEEVLAGESLETRFVDLAGGATAVEGMEWLQSYSD